MKQSKLGGGHQTIKLLQSVCHCKPGCINSLLCFLFLLGKSGGDDVDLMLQPKRLKTDQMGMMYPTVMPGMAPPMVMPGMAPGMAPVMPGMVPPGTCLSLKNILTFVPMSLLNRVLDKL